MIAPVWSMIHYPIYEDRRSAYIAAANAVITRIFLTGVDKTLANSI